MALILTMKAMLPECRSLAGCNVISGVVPLERPWLAGEDPTDADTVTTAFRVWEKPEAQIPVRIVAAQGGGLYAAYYTATYLALRADAEEAFADSLFAISGVSGGSIGAAVFWAIREAGICDKDQTLTVADDCHVTAVRAILGQDYLSRQFIQFFTVDALDSILPISALSPVPIDRAWVLENMVARHISRWQDGQNAQDNVGSSAILTTPITNSWSPDAGLPALFLNATDVHTGARAISSPFAQMRAQGMRSRLDLNAGRDLTVGTAAVMSARFPIISPAGRILVGDQTIQLVDGGYFDNTGLATVHDILSSIERDTQQKVEVISLSIDSGLCHSDGSEEGAVACADRLPKGLIGTPVSTVAASRYGLEDLLKRRFCETWGAAVPEVEVLEARIVPQDFNFTLSWYLSQRSFEDIEEKTRGSLHTPVALCG